MTKKRKKALNQRQSRTTKRPRSGPPPKVTFGEHIQELRKRLFWIAASVIGWSGAAYGVQQYIVKFLLKPSGNQEFIYTTPGGGVDFLFRVCLYTGIIMSIPVIVYQLLKYLAPLMKTESTRFIAIGSIASGILAVAGLVFGYFLGLPAALHFLLHQFTTDKIQALISVQSYMSFVMVYMVGSALMFQVPLVMLFVNKIKPIKWRSLLKYERWVILISFVLAGLMNPTPRVLDQLLVAGPLILMYQIGILIIAVINKPRWPKNVQSLFEEDAQKQAERYRVAKSSQKLV